MRIKLCCSKKTILETKLQIQIRVGYAACVIESYSIFWGYLTGDVQK